MLESTCTLDPSLADRQLASWDESLRRAGPSRIMSALLMCWDSGNVRIGEMNKREGEQRSIKMEMACARCSPPLCAPELGATASQGVKGRALD